MAKRTFSTARKQPEVKPVPRIKPKTGTVKAAGKRSAGAASRNPTVNLGTARSQTRTNMRPIAAAPPPRQNDNTKLIIIGGVAAAFILVMIVAIAAGGSSQRRQPVRQTQPVAQQQRMSTHERMMKQRYGGEMEGKTIQEWMEENGDTDFAKQRREARQKR